MSKFKTHFDHQKHLERTTEKDTTEQCDTSIGSIWRRTARNISPGAFAIAAGMSEDEALATEDRTRGPGYDEIDAINDTQALLERERARRQKKATPEAKPKASATETPSPAKPPEPAK